MPFPLFDPLFPSDRAVHSTGHRSRGGLRQPRRDPDGEGAPLARLALDRDPAAVHLDDVLDERKPEAAPLDIVQQRRADAVEAIEDLGLLLARDADAAVAHRDGDLARL